MNTRTLEAVTVYPGYIEEQMKDIPLQPTEEMFLARSVLEHSSDAFFWVGIDAGFKFVNAAFCRWLGYSHDELLHMTLPQVDEIFDSTCWDQDWRQLRQKKSRTYETKYRTRSGESIPVRVEENYIEHRGKEFHCFSAKDLRKFDQFDGTLHQSEMVLQVIFDSSSDAHLMTDLAGKVLMFNKSANQMAKNYFGFSLHKEDSITRTFYQDDSKDFKSIANLALNGKNTHSEKLFVNHRGEDVWFDYSITPIRDSHGEVVGIWFSAADITERKLIMEFVQQRSGELSKLIENVRGYAVYMVDPTGEVVSWNAGAQRLFGYTTEEISGRHFSTLYTRQDVKSCLPDFELEMAAKNGQHEVEGWCSRKDGGRFWAFSILSALYDNEGRITGFTRSTRDISKNKREKEEQARKIFSALNEF